MLAPQVPSVVSRLFVDAAEEVAVEGEVVVELVDDDEEDKETQGPL